MATSVNNSAWLQWIASLMGGARRRESESFPSNRYYCLLDELPLHLIPRAARQILRDASHGTMVLNPDCTVRSAEDLPEELRARKNLVSAFALQGTIAWVRDAEDGPLLPFWLGSRIGPLLAELRTGEPVPESIPASSVALLKTAGILVAQHESTSERREEFIRAGAQFQERGYAPLRSLIHPLHVAALRRYYRHQIRAGAIHLGDAQSERRYIAHNEPVAQFFHHQLTATISRMAGKALKPSYVYLACYLSGAELKKHTDREQCDYSITFSLDYSPEPKLAAPWPIRLQTPRGTVTVYQALGDGLAYRGTQLPHYRGMLGEGQTSTSIFFHYVTENFAGSLD